MNRRRVARQSRRQSPNQADPPLTTTPRRRASVAEPEEAAKLAIACRARPGHRLATSGSSSPSNSAVCWPAQAIRSGKNLEAIVIDMLDRD